MRNYWHMHTEVQGMIGQRGPAIQHRELYAYSVTIYMGKESERGKDVCVCITESLCLQQKLSVL